MKIHSKKISTLVQRLALSVCLLVLANIAYAQDGDAKQPIKPVKNTFAGNFLLDNQSVMLPNKGIFEFVIQHRFGVINNGYKDFYGLYAPSNIRLGFNYAFHKNVQVGFGFTKERMQWDGNLKLAIVRQSQIDGAGSPLSISYYGLMSNDSRQKKGNFVDNNDRLSYFHQLLFARKITKNFSAQIAPSFSWFNNVEGYISSDSSVRSKMHNGHFAVSFSGSYAVTSSMSIVANYDQPLTEHPSNNPHPNLSLGLQLATSTHTFQIFLSNYQSIIQQANNMYNQNDYTKWQYLIGFNISKR